LLTDQFAPVENLLNPVTNKPYTIDEEIAWNRKVNSFSLHGAAIISYFPMMIASVWIFYMWRDIWKITTMSET
jgi:hypothetical protein